ncbi:MAG: carboxypeptidase-like regulatory domain-containing protein [Ignavibacteriota bacterium]
MNYKSNLVRSVSLVLLGAVLAMAQSDRGSLTGTVKDPSDAGVPAAKLALRNRDTGVFTETETTPTGNYNFSSVPVGVYDLTVQASGFKTSVQKQITIQIDQALRLDVGLDVGSATESVTVEATAEMLKTDNAEQSMNVTGQKLNELPINFGGSGTGGGGIRNWLTFTYLAPGVAVQAPGLK